MLNDQSVLSESDARLQLSASPYAGSADFPAVRAFTRSHGALDPVSIADLLRNAFVYPPHSIYRDVKLASIGFDAVAQDLHAAPSYRFPYPGSPAPVRPAAQAIDKAALVATYHRLLCEAVRASTSAMRAPWVLQSGGKDSTSLAIALAEARPETVCLTYLGGREENEVESARMVARQLGLRHETLVCDPGRAYDRYLAMVPTMPLLSADFALLSYADLMTEVVQGGGDGVLDGCGSDIYFGTPVDSQRRLLTLLARGIKVPSRVFDWGWVSRSFKLCFALSTLGMDSRERYYPGSRFSDAEVDALLGRPVANLSRQRLQLFRDQLQASDTPESLRRVLVAITEAGAALAKGQYTTSALGLQLAFPFCDARLREWVYREVPDESLIDRDNHNKPLVREHIKQKFGELPYVQAKGSFRFDLCGLASQRFDQVHGFAKQAGAILPGAATWLEANRGRLDNKFFASKFYLLAVTLPWLLSRTQPVGQQATGAMADHEAMSS